MGPSLNLYKAALFSYVHFLPCVISWEALLTEILERSKPEIVGWPEGGGRWTLRPEEEKFEGHPRKEGTVWL